MNPPAFSHHACCHHLVLPKDTPLCNVWLTLLHGIGVDAARHGDSTGVVKELIV
jgi:hypothetical protein